MAPGLTQLRRQTRAPFLLFLRGLGLITLCGCSVFPSLRSSLNAPPEVPSMIEGTRITTPKKPLSEKDPIQLQWPIDEFRLSRGFKSGRKRHWGIDLAAPNGTSIQAAHEGLVIYAGRDFKGFGKLVIIENGAWATFYSHCSKILVKEGQWVNLGQKIALVGRTGRATGYHLHFELRRNRIPLDPEEFLPRLQRRP